MTIMYKFISYLHFKRACSRMALRMVHISIGCDRKKMMEIYSNLPLAIKQCSWGIKPKICFSETFIIKSPNVPFERNL